MTTIAAKADRGAAAIFGGRFQPNHAWDRNFFLFYVLAMWTGIGMGFVPQIAGHIAKHKPAYPLIVHFHAAVFVGWLALFTAQVLLIRAHRPDLHRKLGLAMVAVAAVMVVLGPATARVVDGLEFGTPNSDPGFISIQLTDILAFAGLATAAVLLRNRSPAHKRLILMATLYITDAGFSRWLAGPISNRFGDGYWPFLAGCYLANDVLFLGIGAYDLITRRRLHPAYIVGLAWVLGLQLTAGSLYFSSAWTPIATKLIGH